MMLSPTWAKGIFSVDLAVKRDPIKISNAVFSFYQKSLDSDKTGQAENLKGEAGRRDGGDQPEQNIGSHLYFKSFSRRLIQSYC